MRTRSKLILAAPIAALVLGALVSTTSANRIAMTERAFRATWNKIRFIGAAGFANIECHLTIEGSFHSRTGSKILENLVGYITRSMVAESQCTGGSARILGEFLPWHIRYGGFTGTLPRIESATVRIVGSHFDVQALIFGVPITCLFTSSAASPIRDIITRNTTTGVAESLKIEEPARIPKTSGSGTCGESANLEATTTSLTIPGATTKITVTLVA
jgi:hypothetical protein